MFLCESGRNIMEAKIVRGVIYYVRHYIYMYMCVCASWGVSYIVVACVRMRVGGVWMH